MFDDVTIDRSTTADRVAAALRDKILGGEIEPGTPLREVALGQSLGVARSTVREAMQLLTAEGLLTRSLYRGVVVTELTADDVADIYRARAVLELAGIAAATRPGASLDALDDVVATWRQAVPEHDVDTVTAQHLRFHAGLVDLLGSGRINATYAALLADLRLVLATVDRTVDNLPDHLRSHERLLDMIRDGDREASYAELERHLDAAQADVLAHGRLRRPD